MLNMMFHRFDHDDRIVYNQADSQHESEQRKRIDGKTKEWEYDERANEGDRHGQQRDQRRPPALQENVDNKNNQDNGFEECVLDFLQSLGNCQGCVQRDVVF